MIREHEQTVCAEITSIRRSSTHGRTPVFAISASLVEKDRQLYIDCGFDGWIMKPIDFQRVRVLLDGVRSTEIRNSCLYQPGMWEQGGWFKGCE